MSSCSRGARALCLYQYENACGLSPWPWPAGRTRKPPELHRNLSQTDESVPGNMQRQHRNPTCSPIASSCAYVLIFVSLSGSPHRTSRTGEVGAKVPERRAPAPSDPDGGALPTLWTLCPAVFFEHVWDVFHLRTVVLTGGARKSKAYPIVMRARLSTASF